MALEASHPELHDGFSSAEKDKVLIVLLKIQEEIKELKHGNGVVEEEQFLLSKNQSLFEKEVEDLAASVNNLIDTTGSKQPHLEFKD